MATIDNSSPMGVTNGFVQFGYAGQRTADWPPANCWE